MSKVKPLVCPKCGFEITKFKMYYTTPTTVNYRFNCPVCLVDVYILDEHQQNLNKYL